MRTPGSAPAISTVAISSTGGDDATLVASETLEVTVTFDSSVTVSVAGGTPYVTVALTNANRNATYSSGSPTTSRRSGRSSPSRSSTDATW